MTKWHKSSSNPVLEKKKQKEVKNPGPGHYQPQINAVNPIYKNNISSVFASSVARDQQSKKRVMSGTKLATKVTKSQYQEIAKAANSHRGVQDILESDEDDDITPGPGAHWNPSMSQFKPAMKPRRFQNFGSTVVDRFSDNNAAIKINSSENIGPGSYD